MGSFFEGNSLVIQDVCKNEHATFIDKELRVDGLLNLNSVRDSGQF